MNKKEVCNYPGQALGFHFLLWTFIETDKLITKEKLNSRLIGQVHDSMIVDLCPSEAEYLKEKINKIATEELPNHWTFINVPLVEEFDMYGVDKSWAEKIVE
jgi:DNA polymerase I-like protein with 3'-5' exonuclease and polymerase domains